MQHKRRPSEGISKQIEEMLFGDKQELMSELIIKAAEKIVQKALEQEVAEGHVQNFTTNSSIFSIFIALRFDTSSLCLSSAFLSYTMLP